MTQKIPPPSLPPAKLQHFIEEYLNTFDYRVAALKVGISDMEACDLLYHPDVEMMLDRRIELDRRRQIWEKMLEDRVMEETLSIALSDIGDFLADGNEIKNVIAMPSVLRRQVKSIKVTPTKFGPSVSLVMHDKLKALEMIGKSLGMWDKKDKNTDDVQQALQVLTLNQLTEAVNKVKKLEKPEEAAVKL